MQPLKNAAAAIAMTAGCMLAAGCASGSPGATALPPIAGIPRELELASVSEYRVAPPDILLIEAVNNIRPAADPLRAGDELLIQVADGLPIQLDADPEASPIEADIELEFERAFKIVNSVYRVQPDGAVDLGPEYGAVPVAGLTADDAKAAIEQHLRSDEVGLAAPRVAVTMPNVIGRQAITGEHLVRPDGTISLGIYGGVYVAGMSLEEVKAAVEAHLSTFVLQPEVSVDVLAYNSKVYYVIMDGGGYGERVVRVPFTGNETVLDAIAQVEGLSEVSSKQVWIARPAPAGTGCAQVMPVNWNDIAALGVTETNYQVLPGDRIYVKADRFIALDNFLAKVISPVERVFGITLLGTQTAKSINFYDSNRGSGSGGF